MSSYATLQDVISISGATYTEAEQSRINTLLPLIADLIKTEGAKVGKDVDKMITDPAYSSVVKLVTVDVVTRVLRQSTTGEPMQQESQSALGYSWSGTYAVPGGGVTMSLMENEKRTLGFKAQRYGSITLWPIKSKA